MTRPIRPVDVTFAGRSTVHWGNAESVVSKGVSKIYGSNSFKMYGTPVPEGKSINTTSRVPESMRFPSVGHSSRASVLFGANAYVSMPAALKTLSKSVTFFPSWFVSSNVTTSFGFASRKVLTVVR